MISTETSFNFEESEKNRIESHKAEGLRFVPEGDVPKVYCVVCGNASDWKEIHNYIINENEIDGIPNRKIECINPKKTCKTIGSYEISDAEAEQLKNHPKIVGVNLDEGYYEGTYKGRDTFPASEPGNKIKRYGTDVKISRDNSDSGYYNGTDSTWLRKTAAQIHRHQTLANPWKNSDDGTIITDDPEQFGDGTDVDVIVCDTASWFGHIEFVKTGTGEPSNFVGQNVLKSGFATYATTGVCGVLDCVLEGPYYIDPDFFEANGGPGTTGSRLEKRWDGTTVPKEQDARNWWQDETKRSAKFCPIGSTTVDGNAGTAVLNSNEDFGNISVSNNYTRAVHNGSNVAEHTAILNNSNPPERAGHGTPCMSQAYGKTHGWAYNANKWFLSILFTPGAVSTSILYEILKVFHDLKPNRSSDNTKNPTVTSHSWGTTSTFSAGNYGYFRTNSDGTAGSGSIDQIVMGSGQNGTDVTSPKWLSRFRTRNVGNRYERWIKPTNSIIQEGSDMLDSGVIFVGAAGNNNQQLVKGDHPNYNNYVSSSSSETLADAVNAERVVGRVGSPLCIGNLPNYNNGGVDIYRTFAVGALDDDQVSNGNGTYYEQKADYSNMGNAIDFYTIGDGSIGARGGDEIGYSRNDSSYRIDSNYNIVSSGGTLSVTSKDRFFNGTSSACPVGAGLFATKLQYNRDWIWSNLKSWLETRVTVQSNDTEFLKGTEGTTSNDSNWDTERNLQGSERRILFDAPSGLASIKLSLFGGDCNLSGNLQIT